ncbi:E3 ubiquitin-protein ligase hel2-like isoform X2 [Hibiscus syriacus]|uniref:E3 ubiquitin-protein ligase hel2-like isoform X2 n=1 Tax=Hibiscus syriacus TaxID=106335 RepID=UPI001921D074|nr:E3 ubiquitin-protein ligase hel2-like isoform X2 [Hibiscus syriacus]
MSSEMLDRRREQSLRTSSSLRVICLNGIACLYAVCVSKVFTCEQKLYTRAQLDKHIKTGDSEVDGTESGRGGFMGHPICEFCQNPFYGEHELYLHMSTEHFTCHICQRRHPGQYEYYRNYDEMEIHFSQEHHLCEDESCRAIKFVVFATQSELKRHNTVEHGGRMSRSKRNAALQIPISFQYRRSHERDDPVRGHVTYPNSFDGQLSSAMQASLVTVSAESSHYTSTSNRAVVNSGVASVVGCFEALATIASGPSSRYQALENSRVELLEDSSFPPLPAASNSSRQKVRNGSQGSSRRSIAAPSRHRNNGTSNVVSNTAQAWPAASLQPIMSTTNNSSGSSKSKPARIKESSPKLEDFQSANKALVEKIRVSLEFDRDKFSAFKGITGKYRQGIISSEEYLAYVHQFGLSHLVLELAVLLPDVEKRRELVEIYNFNISKGYSHNDVGQWKNREGSKKGKEKCDDHGITGLEHASAHMSSLGYTNKGKSKVSSDEAANSHVPAQSQMELDVGGSSGGGNKQRKKLPKFLRNRLGDASTAQLEEDRKCEIKEKTGENKEPPERLPVHGVWRDGGGQRLMAKTQRIASKQYYTYV